MDRPLHDPDAGVVMADSHATYRARKGTTRAHFDEKLLLLRDRMTTRTGSAFADKRHAFMVEFLAHFDAEWDGLA